MQVWWDLSNSFGVQINVNVLMNERLILQSQEDNLILINDEVGVLLVEIVIKFPDEY